MRGILLVSVLAWNMASPQLAVGGPQKSYFPYPVHAKVLDNGFKALVVPMDSGGLVAYWTVVRTGSRDEFEPGRTGFAHFFEHMMFRGTEKYPAERYNRILTELGADTNAYTSDDHTAYHIAIAAEDLETVMELESDRFKNLAYPESAFQTEAGAVYGEYRKNKMNPFFAIYEKMAQTAFTKHTYGHTAMGYEEDIKAMPGMYDYSRTFFSRYYRPENAVLLIVGDVKPDRVFPLVERYYADWKPGYQPPNIPEEPRQEAERRFEVDYPGRSLPILWAAYKVDAFDPNNKLRVAATVLAELAFGPTSEIYKKLVIDEQVVQFIEADPAPSRDPGLLSIYAMVKEEPKVEYVLAEIDKVTAQFREQAPEARQLNDLKSRLKYEFLMGLDTPSNVASHLAQFISLTGAIEAIDALYAAYDAVSPEDVQAAARKYFTNDQRTVGLLKGKE